MCGGGCVSVGGVAVGGCHTLLKSAQSWDVISESGSSWSERSRRGSRPPPSLCLYPSLSAGRGPRAATAREATDRTKDCHVLHYDLDETIYKKRKKKQRLLLVACVRACESVVRMLCVCAVLLTALSSSSPADRRTHELGGSSSSFPNGSPWISCSLMRAEPRARIAVLFFPLFSTHFNI